MHADRQRTLRELELGRTLFKEGDKWVIRHQASDYKTGRSYGERPPMVIAPHVYPEVHAFAVLDWHATWLPHHAVLRGFTTALKECLTRRTAGGVPGPLAALPAAGARAGVLAAERQAADGAGPAQDFLHQRLPHLWQEDQPPPRARHGCHIPQVCRLGKPPSRHMT